MAVKKKGLFGYFASELTHGYLVDQNDARYVERRERVYTFLKQPVEIEKMMIYGVLLCLDVFLHVFTFLPLRIVIAACQILTSLRSWLQSKTNNKPLLDSAQSCDILKGVIFITCVYFMTYIDTSFIYHTVRAQTLIKLYIIYNMLEVADRLFSSFGQDILDALFFTATESNRKKREFYKVFLHLILAIIYVFFHSLLVLFEATTLNVAFNSHNKVLLTVMMANNFVEIKGTVFKKYDKNNLFQISCSDIRERFHYFVLMLIVLLRNMQQYSWNYQHFTEILPSMITVIASEFVIDWFKHAFVLKFNHIPIGSYKEYSATFAYDVVNSRKKGSISDCSDVVSRRLGFIPLPLAVLIFYVTRISIDFNGYYSFHVVIGGFFVLFLVKLLNSIVIVGRACRYIDDDQVTCKDMIGKKLAVVDPFEQRGSKRILVTEDQSDTGSHGKKRDMLVKLTPAQARSLRAPSVDHTVAAESRQQDSGDVSSLHCDSTRKRRLPFNDVISEHLPTA